MLRKSIVLLFFGVLSLDCFASEKLELAREISRAKIEQIDDHNNLLQLVENTLMAELSGKNTVITNHFVAQYIWQHQLIKLEKSKENTAGKG